MELLTEKQTRELFKVGDKFYAFIPFADVDPMLIHVINIIPSACYRDRTFIHYKVFGKHKQWWHEFFENSNSLLLYKQQAENYLNKNK